MGKVILVSLRNRKHQGLITWVLFWDSLSGQEKGLSGQENCRSPPHGSTTYVATASLCIPPPKCSAAQSPES